MIVRLAVFLIAGLAAPACAQREVVTDRWRESRERMAQEVARDGIRDSATLRALRTVPRHEFVPSDQQVYAYHNTPLPIGHDQTISQPSIVGLMTELIRPSKGKRVLEVGTGSGYQAAVLAETGCEVWTIEIFETLASQARERLSRLGYSNVKVRHGDGYAGWPEEAPFDGIMVTAAADSTPPALLKQLAPGGRLVMPVGNPQTYQELVLIQKDHQGRLAARQLIPVRFVPLLRGVR
ncbi:MAG TPA: protein-L-isoaspartate(D-aspartate) O-methyltransferase [Gemmatimonadales bacterium]|nr:protein-L-isoaspartate(D-aspartate) O-methyltransferase [Gemmatimonadales bacterium]